MKNLLARLTFPYKYTLIEKKSHWFDFAEQNHLTFVRDEKQREDAYVVGYYRTHHLKLEDCRRPRFGRTPAWTRITLSSHNPKSDAPAPSKDHVVNFLSTASERSLALKGDIDIEDDGQILRYEQPDLETDVAYLQFVVDFLSDCLEQSQLAVQLGGEIIPALYPIAVDETDKLTTLAQHLVRSIAQDTMVRFGRQLSHLLCKHCLTGYSMHTLRLHWADEVTYCGCRICGRSRDYVEWDSKRIVAVIDTNMMEKENWDAHGVRVNWLKRQQLFDFDGVEIIRATDEDVERFAVQVGNDVDDDRKLNYKRMVCLIDQSCKLSENTVRILESLFHRVK